LNFPGGGRRNGYLASSAGSAMKAPTDEGPARMRALAAALPAGLRDGYRSGREVAANALDGDTPVCVVGMGGSAIAGDLTRGLVNAETSVPFALVRSPELPRWIDRRSRVFLVSYSGNTWETLRAYEAAARVGADRVAIASGGELADRALQDGVPLLSVPPGMPPRCAVGHLLGGLLGLLDSAFPESNEDRVGRAADRTERLIAQYASARGPAATVARRVGSRLPFVYAESAFLGLARRWKTQIEENAKRLAVFDEVPELFHNALVGWDATARAEAARTAPLLIEWAGASATIEESFAYLRKLLRTRGAAVLDVALRSEDRLEALVGGIALGDHVSLFLADRRHVDPYPVTAIARLKATVGRPRRAAR
jgi:glucose/mannose-6-phosphate isomerase